MGKPILMGRKTFESIGKPLPGRTTLILTRQEDYNAEGCTVVRNLDEAKAAVPDAGEIMVIGGAEVYALTLPEATRLYITDIDAVLEGDVWFPDFELGDWRETSREDHGPDEANPYSYSFITLERKQS